jgi:phage-related minor tail protein
MEDEATKGEMVKAWIKAFDDFNQLAVPALEEVEEQFRSLLGVAEEVVPAAGLAEATPPDATQH